MVIKHSQMQTEKRENMRGGSGAVYLQGLVPADSLPDKCRLFSVVTLEKGCSIGSHTHEQETEVYYVLEGEAIYDDNGTTKAMSVGDCSICVSGEAHAIANEKETPLRFIAAIIKN